MLVILISITLLYSCEKSIFCKPGKKDKGLIKGKLDYCTWIDTKDGLVINNQAELDSLHNQFGCDELPTFDFAHGTILAVYSSGGCKMQQRREVIWDGPNAQYIYRIEVSECGLCKAEQFSNNWVHVEKLPDGWTVTFEVVDI